MKPEILPKEVNPTEERQIRLLFNLLRNKSGLSLERLQNRLMPNEYANGNRESDRKKFKRDIDELKKLGFAIKRYADDLDENKSIYKIIQSEELKIKFTVDELKQLSLSILKHYNNSGAEALFYAAGKLFASNLGLFPPFKKKKNDLVIDNTSSSIILKLVQALRDKIPLRIDYLKNVAKGEIREIEPLRLIKRNAEDFYLVAWDRKEKSIRKLVIAKITKITELDGDFLFKGGLTAKDINFHPLNVGIHKSEKFSFSCNLHKEWKMKNFLSGYSFIKKDDIYTIETTNQQAFFDFILREYDILIHADANLLKNFRAYLEELGELYES